MAYAYRRLFHFMWLGWAASFNVKATARRQPLQSRLSHIVPLALAGLLFTVWARVHLGRNWSGTITVKQDHELITGGPYRFVRHPIYSGLLLALIGLALARGEWRGIVAVALAFGAFWRKLGRAQSRAHRARHVAARLSRRMSRTTPWRAS